MQVLRRTTTGLVGLLTGLACQACQGTVAGDGSDAAAPWCEWPAAFDSPDAAAGQCRAARYYLSCQGSNGGVMECMSDSLTECPGPNITPGVTYSNCQNQCGFDEYALACGSVGPGPWPDPPATCRLLPPNPGGGRNACCPCGA
jgi:hypothetical protein